MEIKRIGKRIVFVVILILVIQICGFTNKVHSATTYRLGNIIFEGNDDDGTAKIVGYDGSNTTLDIPEYLGEYKVIAISINSKYTLENVTSLVLPSTVNSIENFNLPALNSISVDSKNPYFVAENGILFDKQKAILVLYPSAKSDSTYTIPSNTTTIGKYAFCNSTLSGINIPDSVTNIEKGAFLDSASLETITIPKNVTIISDSILDRCTSLTSVTIPNGVTTIEDYAFGNCTSLRNITLPNNLTTIGDSAFYNCTKLEKIDIPEGVKDIGSLAFRGCSKITSIEIPSSVTSFGKRYDGEYLSPFDECTNLISINVDSNNSTYISEGGIVFNKDKTELYAYPAAKSETSYTLPSSVNIIHGLAFGSNVNLQSVIINNVSKMEYGAFYDATGLRNIQISGDNIELGAYTFQDCSNLTYIKIESNNVYNVNFGGCTNLRTIYISGVNNFPYYSGSCPNLTNVTIEANNIKLPSDTFASLKYLTNIELSGITEIGEYAFRGCSSLTNITIPEGVTTIKQYAFWSCNSLTNIIIPKSVTAIEDKAFEDCDNLTIRGYINSEAQAYAKANNIKFVAIDSYVEKIQAWTTIADYLANVQSNAIMTVYDINGNKITDETRYIGTGMVIKVIDGNEETNKTIIVIGDVTGDGEIKLLDVSKVNQHFVGKTLLEGVYLKAADMSGDGEVRLLDVSQINQTYVNH